MNTQLVNAIEVDPNISFLVETTMSMKKKQKLVNSRNTFKKGSWRKKKN